MADSIQNALHNLRLKDLGIGFLVSLEEDHVVFFSVADIMLTIGCDGRPHLASIPVDEIWAYVDRGEEHLLVCRVKLELAF